MQLQHFKQLDSRCFKDPLSAENTTKRPTNLLTWLLWAHYEYLHTTHRYSRQSVPLIAATSLFSTYSFTTLFTRIYLQGFGKGLVDEDYWYEHGKALLGEASDVANEKAEVKRHDYQ